MIPSRYAINVAKAGSHCTVTGKPIYYWFFTVDAGDNFDHAKKVEAAVKAAFPAPEYDVTCHQKYSGAMPVETFDWRANT